MHYGGLIAHLIVYIEYIARPPANLFFLNLANQLVNNMWPIVEAVIDATAY